MIAKLSYFTFLSTFFPLLNISHSKIKPSESQPFVAFVCSFLDMSKDQRKDAFSWFLTMHGPVLQRISKGDGSDSARRPASDLSLRLRNLGFERL